LPATTAFRNGSLQGGYLILAERVLGHDCEPLSGLDNAKVNQEFFPGVKSQIKSNFLCNLGLRRSLEASSAQPAPELRRGVRAAVIQIAGSVISRGRRKRDYTSGTGNGRESAT
jgi:hypothetical protein